MVDKPFVKETVVVKDTKSTKDLPAPKAPTPFINKIPDGAMDPNDVRPGYGPLEGSPKENDPSRLQNPENPNSPITVPSNPSNPANMPAMQSEKTASEVGIHMRLAGLVEDVPVSDARKAALKERDELNKEVGKTLEEFGSESAIPASHPYWANVAKIRTLNNP
jgi:hypothetical protein